jgi:hypothetical protein
MAIQHGLQGIHHFMNGLVKFRLAWVLGFHEVENVIYVLRRITRERFHDSTHNVSSDFHVLNELTNSTLQ